MQPSQKQRAISAVRCEKDATSQLTLNVRFTINGMCTKNKNQIYCAQRIKTKYIWCEQATEVGKRYFINSVTTAIY